MVGSKQEWIIFFGEDWARHNSTGQYLAIGLSKHINVLWINSLGLRVPNFNKNDFSRILTKLREFISGSFGKYKSDQKQENIVVLTLLAIPLYKFGLVRWINRILIRRMLLLAMKKLNISNPVVVSACPASADVMDDIHARLKIYYCADEYSIFPGLDADAVQKLERDLMGKVDLVFVTSKMLEKSKKKFHKNIFYLPHGVDYNNFRRAVSCVNKPDDIKTLHGPLIGFVGLIGEHIDLEKIQYIAENLVEGNIVMIGPVEAGTELPKNNRIHYLGAKEQSQLPEYQAHFDVCIVPYKHSIRVKYANPTKIREYLAAGCPVVSICQPEAELIDAPIKMANSNREFTQYILDSISVSNKLNKEEISLTMKNHDWSNRAEEFIDVINNYIDDVVVYE